MHPPGYRVVSTLATCLYSTLQGLLKRTSHAQCVQVALPHYMEPWFIRRAVARYRQFLYLKLLFKNEFISPPYDLDLLWHLHMVRAL